MRSQAESNRCWSLIIARMKSNHLSRAPCTSLCSQIHKQQRIRAVKPSPQPPHGAAYRFALHGKWTCQVSA